MKLLLIHTAQRDFRDSGLGRKMFIHLLDVSWPCRKTSYVDY